MSLSPCFTQNVFVRLRNLPSVSITFEVIGRLYSDAKAANPFVSSVCGVCEEGVRSAGSLAARSMQPAVHMLQPQLVAANSLVCRGLDRLEEKVPALEYPPTKLASGIGDLVSSAVRSPAVQYVLSSKLSQLAEEGADTALTFTERLVNYILPASGEEKEEVLEVQKSNVSATGPKPGFRRLGALASTVWRRAYGQTAMRLQQTKSQGQQLAACIPSVTPLGVVGFLSSLFDRDRDLWKQLQKTYVSVVNGAKRGSLASMGPCKGQHQCAARVSGHSKAENAGQHFSLEASELSLRYWQAIAMVSQLSGLSSKPREEILYNGGGGENTEQTKNQSNGSPAVESNGSDQRNNPSHNSQESVKDGEPMDSLPSEELHLLHTKQSLEKSRPEPHLES
ncbi:hypothetical protein NFI96_022701 [Prochilodus magdalenae]|nr:hypothetical protein NFI96_022701 [Prochilodus magdalenae]